MGMNFDIAGGTQFNRLFVGGGDVTVALAALVFIADIHSL